MARVVFLFLLLTYSSLRAAEQPFPDPADPLSGMGLNIHFTDAQPGELEMIAQAGFRWVRMDFHWDRIEKTPGVYDFSAYDRLLDSLDKVHLHALLILDYGNPLYDNGNSPANDETRAAFAKWAVASLGHFKNRGVLWEVWNEPNGGSFWKPNPNADDYAKLALTVSKAMHEANPNEMVVGPALSGANLGFVEVSAKAGVLPYWSGVTIHPYFQHAPESYGVAYEKTRALIKKYAKPGQAIDVMCGESGYSTSWSGIDETTHGKYLARLFLFDVLTKVPLTIWYDWRDDGLDPKNAEHNFGIVHHDYHAGAAEVYDPKPAYLAAETYGQQLSGYRFKERIKTDSPDGYVLSFTQGEKTCFVAWTAGLGPHAVKIPAPDGVYTVTSYDGKEVSAVKAAGGAMTLVLDDGPQYFKLK